MKNEPADIPDNMTVRFIGAGIPYETAITIGSPKLGDLPKSEYRTFEVRIQNLYSLLNSLFVCSLFIIP